MKFNRKIVIITVVITFVVIISIFLGAFKSVIDRPLKINSKEEIVISEGDSFYSVLNNLKNENKIRNITFIKLYTKIFNNSIEVLPGRYQVDRDITLKELLLTLSESSKHNYINFTIPEGYTIDDIAEKLEQQGITSKEKFIEAVLTYPLPDFVKVNSNKRYNLEGYLFPDTYQLQLGIEPTEIVDKLVKRFIEVWNEVVSELKVTIADEDIEEFITIASVIEKEARVDEERPLIASVIKNRLEIGMPLQVDATVIYAHGYHIDTVLYKHLEIESPYNTYINNGLPIGPISNPGVPSIISALKPEKTDYLYYLLETEKSHYFTNDYDDFLRRKDELGY